jgi:hypothetical protein
VGGMRLYPQRNLLDREAALRMWTENVTWFSNEEGKKGRIAAGQLADLMVPDRDFLRCPEDDIADTTSLLTVVGGKVVYGAGPFSELDPPLPPAMPDWSPVRNFGGYGAWGAMPGALASGTHRAGDGHARTAAMAMAAACGCASQCGMHGHQHATAWTRSLPIADLKSFWGALGCSCWAV